LARRSQPSRSPRSPARTQPRSDQWWRRKRHQDHPAFKSAPAPDDEEAKARADALRGASEENQSPDYRGRSDRADSDTGGSAGGRKRAGGGGNTVERDDSDSTADSGKKSSSKELDNAVGSGDSSDKGSSSTPKELEAAIGSGDEE
jgi:hypothetical protein